MVLQFGTAGLASRLGSFVGLLAEFVVWGFGLWFLVFFAGLCFVM